MTKKVQYMYIYRLVAFVRGEITALKTGKPKTVCQSFKEKHRDQTPV